MFLTRDLEDFGIARLEVERDTDRIGVDIDQIVFERRLRALEAEPIDIRIFRLPVLVDVRGTSDVVMTPVEVQRSGEPVGQPTLELDPVILSVIIALTLVPAIGCP